ncbi:hypothetical protein CDL12_28638 [Handroanthus impetiginosus]|uniref:Uncharacterized protein n=1 Tax=Handroanthus impetiginosus TaxID=429701 RepID=A0A2G9G102_9LAMI|nr:hypothetical protein CDL12_28638 [Handroanthus impetiginosus]
MEEYSLIMARMREQLYRVDFHFLRTVHLPSSSADSSSFLMEGQGGHNGVDKERRGRQVQPFLTTGDPRP